MSEIDAAELATPQRDELTPYRSAAIALASYAVWSSNSTGDHEEPWRRIAKAIIAARKPLIVALEKAGIVRFDNLCAEMRTAYEALRAERDSARALLRDIETWAKQRCPCDNDEPKICPLCDADVAKDRCMAVDVSFPRSIRARIALELGQ